MLGAALACCQLSGACGRLGAADDDTIVELVLVKKEELTAVDGGRGLPRG